MLISFKGQQHGDVFIPPFTLQDGEIAVIRIPAGARRQEMKKVCLDMLLSVTDMAVRTEVPFTYVDEAQQSFMGRLLHPVSVKDYIRKYGSPANAVARQVYDTDENIFPNDRFNSLTPAGRKLVALYTALSWSHRMIIDLGELDKAGARQVYKVVKQYADIGGSAVVLVSDDDLQEKATHFVSVSVKKETENINVA
ncbi:hypothetical protein [uncultured Chitinophaga sp.]|uniref:hypothetical protein n=1 Tax=uncultured Chitinophaga sp. TaxID=339340 RepID=UPI0025EB8816|nr:hypothetical protein [uncultured Chitinophaga sp.]